MIHECTGEERGRDTETAIKHQQRCSIKKRDTFYSCGYQGKIGTKRKWQEYVFRVPLKK